MFRVWFPGVFSLGVCPVLNAVRALFRHAGPVYGGWVRLLGPVPADGCLLVSGWPDPWRSYLGASVGVFCVAALLPWLGMTLAWLAPLVVRYGRIFGSVGWCAAGWLGRPRGRFVDLRCHFRTAGRVLSYLVQIALLPRRYRCRSGGGGWCAIEDVRARWIWFVLI